MKCIRNGSNLIPQRWQREFCSVLLVLLFLILFPATKTTTGNSPTHVSKNAQSRISGNRLEDNAAFLKLRAELKMHLN